MKTNMFAVGTLIICIIFQTFGEDNSKDEYNELVDNFLPAYDETETSGENFDVLHSIFCPESTFCPEDISQKSKWVDYALNESSKAYEWIFSNHSVAVVEARRRLLTLSEQMKGCCKGCSCEKNCEGRQNCCPLSVKKNADKQNKSKILQECVHSSINQHIDYTVFYGRSYYMVVDCFIPNASDEQTNEKCRYPDANYIDHVTPVYSPYTDRTYRNKFCAMCNNDVNVTSWTLRIFLSTPLTLSIDSFAFPSNATSLYKILINTRKLGNVVAVPPEKQNIKEEDPLCVLQHRFRPLQCSAKYLDRNDSIQFLYDACLNFKHEYSYYRGRYSNVFCFFCLNSLPPTGNTMCNVHHSDQFKNAFRGFTSILSPEDKMSTQDTPSAGSITSRMECGCGDYFDIKKNICRELLCPFGEARSECHCKEFTKNISGLDTRVYTELTVMLPMGYDSTGINTDEYGQKVEGYVSRYFKSHWKSVYFSVVAIFQEHTPYDKEQLKFHILLMITVKYGYNWREEMKNIFDQLWKGKQGLLKGIPVFLTLGPIYDVAKIEDLRLIVTNNYGTTIRVNSTSLRPTTKSVIGIYQSVRFNRLLFCEQINLFETEVDILHELSNTKGYSASHLTRVYRKEGARICFDDYVNIFLNPPSAACEILMEHLHFGWLIVLCAVFHNLFARQF